MGSSNYDVSKYKLVLVSVLLWNCLSQCLGESTSLLFVGALVLKHRVLVFLSREEYCIALLGALVYCSACWSECLHSSFKYCFVLSVLLGCKRLTRTVVSNRPVLEHGPRSPAVVRVIG